MQYLLQHERGLWQDWYFWLVSIYRLMQEMEITCRSGVIQITLHYKQPTDLNSHLSDPGDLKILITSSISGYHITSFHCRWWYFGLTGLYKWLTGLYPFLTSSMAASVFVATSCFSEISSDKILLDDRISMAVSSSKMFPCENYKLK